MKKNKESGNKANKPNKKWGKRHTEEKKKRLLDCFAKLCDITEACKKVKINRCTYYVWVDSDEKFKAALEEIDRWHSNMAEGKLLKLVNGYKYIETTKEHSTVLGGSGNKITSPVILTKEVLKEVQPNINAIRTYLLNRDPERWKDKRVLVGDSEHPIEVTLLRYNPINEKKPKNKPKSKSA